MEAYRPPHIRRGALAKSHEHVSTHTRESTDSTYEQTGDAGRAAVAIAEGRRLYVGTIIQLF
jgi:hypothetical protein